MIEILNFKYRYKCKYYIIFSDKENILISGDIDQSIQVISQDLANFRQNIIHELMKNINDFVCISL